MKGGGCGGHRAPGRLLAQVVQLLQTREAGRGLVLVTLALAPPPLGRLQLVHLALELIDVALQAFDGLGQTVRDRQADCCHRTLRA